MDKERDLQDEISFHQAMKERKYRQLGLTPREASDKAKRDFGGYEKFK